MSLEKHSWKVDVMRALLPAATRQFAVISVRTGPHRERMVLAYPDEKTLRGLVAEPSIVALGYNSREAAEAGICSCKTTAQGLPRRSMEASAANRTRALEEFVGDRRSAEFRLSLGGTQGIICSVLQQAFAAAVVLFYSKNLVSAAVRALISF
jgi:hypothetical protein